MLTFKKSKKYSFLMTVCKINILEKVKTFQNNERIHYIMHHLVYLRIKYKYYLSILNV